MVRPNGSHISPLSFSGKEDVLLWSTSSAIDLGSFAMCYRMPHGKTHTLRFPSRGLAYARGAVYGTQKQDHARTRYGAVHLSSPLTLSTWRRNAHRLSCPAARTRDKGSVSDDAGSRAVLLVRCILHRPELDLAWLRPHPVARLWREIAHRGRLDYITVKKHDDRTHSFLMAQRVGAQDRGAVEATSKRIIPAQYAMQNKRASVGNPLEQGNLGIHTGGLPQGIIAYG